MPSPSLGCPFSFFVFSTLLLHRQRREAWCVWAGGFGGGHKLYEKGWARCFFLLHNAPQPPANTRSSTRLGGANE